MDAPEPALSSDLVLRILSSLPDSHKAAVGKLVCKGAYTSLGAYKTIHISSVGEISLKFLIDSVKKGMLPAKKLLFAVVSEGKLDRLQILQQHGYAIDWFVCFTAAENGHLHILQWIKAVCRPRPCWDVGLFDAAAAGGHVQVLEWLRSQNLLTSGMPEYLSMQQIMATCQSCSG